MNQYLRDHTWLAIIIAAVFCSVVVISFIYMVIAVVQAVLS